MAACKYPFRYLFLLPGAHRSRSQTDKATRTQLNRHPNVTGNCQTWNTTNGHSTSSTVFINFLSKLHAVESCFACDAKSIDLSFAQKRHETIKPAITLVIWLFLDMPGFPKQRKRSAFQQQETKSASHHADKALPNLVCNFVPALEKNNFPDLGFLFIIPRVKLRHLFSGQTALSASCSHISCQVALPCAQPNLLVESSCLRLHW